MRNTRSRRQQILQLLIEHGSVQVADLVERFGVSAVTIRADLTHFESQGLANRTHGGATLVRTPPQEQDIHEKDALNLPLKESIGACAARLVRPGDNIIIDSGSTTMTLARHLRTQRDVTVMTNGLNIAWELANAPGINVLLTGGLLRQQSLSLQGSRSPPQPPHGRARAPHRGADRRLQVRPRQPAPHRTSRSDPRHHHRRRHRRRNP